MSEAPEHGDAILTGPDPEGPKEDEILEEEAKKPKDPPESSPEREEPEASLNHEHEKETPSPPEKESNNETTPDADGEYANGEQEGNKAQGFLDKFSEPVLKDNKLHNPSNDYIGAKHSAGTDKFSEPVLKEKIKTPTSAHVGQKHSATGLDFHNSPKDAVKTGTANRNEWSNVQGPKGNFQWVQVGGTWKKQYDESNNAGAAAPSPQQEEQPTIDSNSEEE